MTPGTYLRTRREAAGLSIDNVAQLIVQPWGELQISAAYIRQIEADNETAEDDGSLELLRGAFRFDRYIYLQLAAGLPIPALCRVCACSWEDACDDEATGPCSWTERDLCSACVGKDARTPAPAPAAIAAPTISDLLIRRGSQRVIGFDPVITVSTIPVRPAPLA
jgi:transcriptional regulator with XRE-family HTH domain